MKFKVPIEKDLAFAQDLFSIISEHVSDLAIDNEKIPNKIIFSGQLGNELYLYIKEKEWNFKGFGLEKTGGLVDSIVFKYDAPLIQRDERFGTTFEGGSLKDKTINGIPGPETTDLLLSVYSSLGYSIERTIRPEKKILLVRK